LNGGPVGRETCEGCAEKGPVLYRSAHGSYGGDASQVDLTNVAHAMCGAYACVARKNDGTGVAWGDHLRGGDASNVDLTHIADLEMV